MLGLAIAGKMKSGKTTLSSALRNEFTDIIQYSFAQPIKDAAKILGLSIDGPDKDRVFMQFVSQHCTNKNTNHFVDMLFNRNPGMGLGHLAVIDDARSLPEFERLQEEGFMLVKLEVSEETQIERGADPDTLNHSTETQIDQWDDWDLILPEDTTVLERVRYVRGTLVGFLFGTY